MAKLDVVTGKIKLDSETHKKLKALAEKDRRTLAQIIRFACEEYVAKKA